MQSGSITQRMACKAVIGLNSKVLVLREGSTYEEGTQLERWGFPGGRINPGEPFLEGLQREVMEETGLEIATQAPFYVGEWFPVIKGQPNQIVAIFFACTPRSGTLETDVRLSEEHDEYRWITADEAHQLDLMSPDDEVLITYFNRSRD